MHISFKIWISDAIAPQRHKKIRIRNALRVPNACTDHRGHMVEIYKKLFIYKYAMLYRYAYAMLVPINGATTLHEK
jgi:hypothetical protein